MAADKHPSKLMVLFYVTDTGNEPVREWLRSLPMAHKKIIGEDLKTIQYGWPLGMPLVRKMEPGIWEMRTKLPTGIVRMFFTINDKSLVLLHGFIKKSQKTPTKELDTARNRKKDLER